MFVEIGVMFVMLWAGIRFGMRARVAGRSDVKWALLGAVLGLAGGFVLGTAVNALGGSALVGVAGLAVALGLCELAGKRMIHPAGPQPSPGVSGSLSGQTDPLLEVEDTTAVDPGSVTREELPVPETKGSRRGTIIDFLLPIVIAQVAFFGTQAYLNSGGGFEVRLGIGMLLKMTIIAFGLYQIVIRRILKAIRPGWWRG